VLRIQRLASLAAMATLTVVALAACGGGSKSSSPAEAPAPVSSAPASTPAAASGVTTPADAFGAACSKLPQGDARGSLNAMSPEPVATAASTNPLLKTLVTAIKTAGLTETLNSAQSLTVFAPYDQAFAAVKKSLGDQKFNALLANKDALGNVLKYHVVGKRYDRTGLVSAGNVEPLAGGELKVADTGSTITVADGTGQTANVLCGNIPTANATVFVIDKVLMSKKF